MFVGRVRTLELIHGSADTLLPRLRCLRLPTPCRREDTGRKVVARVQRGTTGTQICMEVRSIAEKHQFEWRGRIKRWKSACYIGTLLETCDVIRPMPLFRRVKGNGRPQFAEGSGCHSSFLDDWADQKITKSGSGPRLN